MLATHEFAKPKKRRSVWPGLNDLCHRKQNKTEMKNPAVLFIYFVQFGLFPPEKLSFLHQSSFSEPIN